MSRETTPPGPSVPRVLAQALGAAVLDYRCRSAAHEQGLEEHNREPSVVFIRRGLFARRQQGEVVVADANHVLFFNAGPYQIAHPVEGGDDCTILALSPALAREAVARHSPRDAEDERAPFRIGQSLSSARAARLHYELVAEAGRGRLAFEDALAELLDEAVGNAYAQRGTAPSPPAGAARRHRDLAEAVKLELARDLAAAPSLPELAATLDCSPFHLSRVFRGAAGLSLRAYLARLRARVAASRLLGGQRDLTTLALELGYADHSHFTNSFRREWGVPPSAFRARLAASRH